MAFLGTACTQTPHAPPSVITPEQQQDRAALAEEAKALYAEFLGAPDIQKILDLWARAFPLRLRKVM